MYSKTVSNPSYKIFTETKMKLLEKGLDFASVQRTLNQPEHRQVFEEFCHRMNCKLHFHNGFSEMYCKIPGFRPKSSCFSPRGHASLEIF